jgi:hypothetical protein
MPTNLLKKTCPYCNRSFLTYEKEMNYCSSVCDGKFRYNERFGIKTEFKEKFCLFCGEMNNKNFCNSKCSNAYEREKTTKRSKEQFVKEKSNNFNRLPYHVLNKIAERKRVMKDDKWLYTINRNRI